MFCNNYNSLGCGSRRGYDNVIKEKSRRNITDEYVMPDYPCESKDSFEKLYEVIGSRNLN